MRRFGLALLTVACTDAAPEPAPQGLDAPESNPVVADERLVGRCLRGADNQYLGKIVAVEDNPQTTGPVYRVQSPQFGPRPIYLYPSETLPSQLTRCPEDGG